MGGKADGARRRKRKTFREAFEAVLSLPATVQEDNEIVNAAIEACPELTQQEAIAIAIVGKAARGSIDAAAFVRDTIGERPIDKQEVSTSGGVDVTITVVRDEHRN